MAEKILIVVESPSKAKTINKYLGTKYTVEASVGHIKDLSKSNLGVDVENDFTPKYITIKGKADVIKKLKEKSKKSKSVLIATDPDREGEAIAYHIAESIAKDNSDIKRVIFHEITKDGIKRGISDPREIDMNIFMSQQARRVMDRLIGFQVSPFLSRALIEKTSAALSAGRVQSVALRLICEREATIDAFKPIEYWNITGDFSDNSNNKIKSRLVSFNKKLIKNPEGSADSADPAEKAEINSKLSKQHYIRNEEQAKDLVKQIKATKFEVSDVKFKRVKRKPQAPFTTSTLQQEASRRLGMSNKRTMSIAQKLYEGVEVGSDGLSGLITYMRTDSTRISKESQMQAREFIEKTFGKDYVPAYIPEYTSKSTNSQDAHEAVRPTNINYTPTLISKYLSKEESNLYELIYNRFLASQMSPAELDQTTIDISGNDFIFRATGSVVAFKGFLAIYDDISDDNAQKSQDSQLLPTGLKVNTPMDLLKVASTQTATKAPPRFNQASLIKELDELGIGRPSTYAAIVSTILEREYVLIDNKVFSPTELGVDVNEVLVKHFPDLFNVKFTADMELELDKIAEGELEYKSMLLDFYDPFKLSLANAEKTADIPDILCPKCESPMVIRVSRNGRFFGCSQYPECNGTRPLPTSEKKSFEKKVLEPYPGKQCPKCGDAMVLRESKAGKFFGCISYPKCDGLLPFSTNVKCPKCKEGELVEKFSRKTKKKFFSCSNYPKCDYLTNYEPLDQRCGNCGHYYIEIRLKKTQDGWLKYAKCPECKTDFTIAE
jgi:DNA topoisomerase I